MVRYGTVPYQNSSRNSGRFWLFLLLFWYVPTVVRTKIAAEIAAESAVPTVFLLLFWYRTKIAAEIAAEFWYRTNRTMCTVPYHVLR